MEDQPERDEGQELRCQIIYKGQDPFTGQDRFLLRVGKDASRHMIGTKSKAEEKLTILRAEVIEGT
ncbi:MAG: hypothetical protein PVI57_22920 [Gemmatimonadota bacterium]